MKKTRTRILEDMIIAREKIKTDSNSLRVENTAEDLKASISCIESNKLEQITTSIANGDEYDSPSINNPSPVEGVTGDVKLNVRTNNVLDITDTFQNVRYGKASSTRLESKVINIKDSIIDKNQTLILSTNLDVSIYQWAINICDYPSAAKSPFGVDSGWQTVKTYKLREGFFENRSKNFLIVISRRDNDNITADEINNKFYFQVEYGDKVTDYVEHKEQNFTISIGSKTLYKGDKIIRKNGKWYFLLKWAVINDFSRLVKNSTVDGMYRASMELSNKIVDASYLNFNTGYSNVFKTVNNGSTYNKTEGFTVGKINNKGKSHLWIYINGFDNYSTKEYQQALDELGAYFIIPFKNEELEEISDPILINQLDKILYQIKEYDDITNFDFDKDVTFEIEVEKSEMKLQKAEFKQELESLKNEITKISALALESEA